MILLADCTSTALSMMVLLLYAAQMLRRDLNAVASNATETAAWGKLWAKQSARGRRTPLEIAKEQEKYGACYYCSTAVIRVHKAYFGMLRRVAVVAVKAVL
eukprot:15781-Heterococcus_DN1.PRE.1